MDGVGHLSPPGPIKQRAVDDGLPILQALHDDAALFRQVVDVNHFLAQYAGRLQFINGSHGGVVIDDRTGLVDNEQAFAESVEKGQEFLISDIEHLIDELVRGRLHGDRFQG